MCVYVRVCVCGGGGGGGCDTVCMLAGCLMSQQRASIIKWQICSDKFTCLHTEIEVADQTLHATWRS